MVIGLLSMFLLTATFAVPPANSQASLGPGQLEPSIIPPVNTGILKDPSGTYTFYNITGSSYFLNISSYESLMLDPFSTHPTGQTTVTRSMIEVSVASQPSSPHYPRVLTTNWAGAGGGDCSSITVGILLSCNGSAGTLGTAGVYSASLTWQSSCYSGAVCNTSFWAGLSPQDSGNSPLVQNGMDMCVNDLADCSKGGHNGQSGAQSWEAWDECYVSELNDHLVWTPVNPTTINGVSYEFVFAYVTSSTQPTFQWIIGSWNYSFTDNVPSCPQTSFQQSEGIMEQWTGAPLDMVVWSPNPNVVTGWWETGKWCGCTYQSGYLGSSYKVGLYDIESGSTLVAFGGVYSSTQFSITD